MFCSQTLTKTDCVIKSSAGKYSAGTEICQVKDLPWKAHLEVQPQTSTREWNISERANQLLRDRRKKKQTIRAKSLPSGKTLSGPQNAILRYRPLSVLYHVHFGWSWISYCWIFFQGKGKLNPEYQWIHTDSIFEWLQIFYFKC